MSTAGSAQQGVLPAPHPPRAVCAEANSAIHPPPAGLCICNLHRLRETGVAKICLLTGKDEAPSHQLLTPGCEGRSYHRQKLSEFWNILRREGLPHVGPAPLGRGRSWNESGARSSGAQRCPGGTSPQHVHHGTWPAAGVGSDMFVDTGGSVWDCGQERGHGGRGGGAGLQGGAVVVQVGPRGARWPVGSRCSTQVVSWPMDG